MKCLSIFIYCSVKFNRMRNFSFVTSISDWSREIYCVCQTWNLITRQRRRLVCTCIAIRRCSVLNKKIIVNSKLSARQILIYFILNNLCTRNIWTLEWIFISSDIAYQYWHSNIITDRCLILPEDVCIVNSFLYVFFIRVLCCV